MGAYNWNWGIFGEEVATGGEKYYQWFLSGMGLTIASSLGAWVIALLLGTIVGTLCTTRALWLVIPCSAWIEIFRNIPLIVQMFLWFFVFPDLLPLSWGDWVKQSMPYPELITAIVSLGLFTSARIAVQVKAAIFAIPKGQTDAALSLGLNSFGLYRYVLLPRAFRVILPPLTSEFMNVFKNSSVALTIGLLELTAQARQMNEYTFQGFEVFTVATILYILLAFIANRLMALIEKRSSIIGYGGID